MLFAGVVSALFSPAFAAAEDTTRFNVVDYFLRLPDGEFALHPASYFLPLASVVDKQNGYIAYDGDDFFPAFQVALFRYRDNRPLIALSMWRWGEPLYDVMKFFTMGNNGAMKKVPDYIFPIPCNEDANCKRHFDLPRVGQAVTVREQGRSGLIKVTWDGAEFVREK
jgi:hypothetical protein